MTIDAETGPGPESVRQVMHGGVAALYNSAVAAFALSTAWEIGALDVLREDGALDCDAFAADRGLDAPSLVGIIRALASVGIVRRHGHLAERGPLFDDAYRSKSFVHWFARGTSPLFQQMTHALHSGNRTGRYFSRDAAAIAYACREINTICYDPDYWDAVDRLGEPPRHVVDLGCGSGGRLFELLERFPGARGTGIDIARPSLEVARDESVRRGLDSRATFVEGDVLRLEARPEFADADLVTCFMMGHDFWPRERCAATLRQLREAFPSARRLLLGDATRTAYADDDLPVFTVGFELAHDLMDVRLPSVEEWESVLDGSGWTLLRTNRIEVAAGEVLFELG